MRIVLLYWDDGMDEGVEYKSMCVCVCDVHIWELLNFKIWSSYAYFRGGQSSLTG